MVSPNSTTGALPLPNQSQQQPQIQPPPCQVRVGVRVRPLTSGEISANGRGVVEANSFDRTVSLAKRKFTFDAVFDSHVTQTDLYQAVSPSLLGSFLDGYNATIMAYGQTGSGKTFTMGSEAHGTGEMNEDTPNFESSGNAGLIPRFMNDIFASLEEQKRSAAAEAAASAVSPIKMKPAKDDGATNSSVLTNGSSGASSQMVDYRLSASFLEVYGEDVHDLLDEDRKVLPLREDGSNGVIVVGLKNQPVSTASEALNVLHVGTLNRTTAATLMNHQSSRSHAVFTVNLQQTIRNNETGVDVTSSSRFTFVDLAGSERMKKTGAEGQRAREGIRINEGLLALGNVINALADEERLAKGGNKVHVPYRQSKLTRLLQDALGGNSQTLFLACVSPSDSNASETVSSLHYANRARNIKNAPTKNIDATMMEVQRLYALTYVLQNELVKQVFQGGSLSPSNSKSSSSLTSKMVDIGTARADLFERKEVKEYMEKIQAAAEEKQHQSGSIKSISYPLKCAAVNKSSRPRPANEFPIVSSFSLDPMPLSKRQRPGSRDLTLRSHPPSDNNHGPSEQLLDAAFLADVDPDGDMAILDQLLEIQHHDQEYDKAQKEDQVHLEQVEDQIEEQERLLLQLKENMKVYHDMKDRYEGLMGEVQSLEAEKASLARELDRVQGDPTKGCSVAIKQKLEKVEMSLARARSETRKHQQMYRRAEQEAHKCKALERKISDLKQGKVALMKKQREAAIKHRTFMDAKAREIHALKKKERKAGQKVSQLETECQKYKTSLERRKQYCDKLQDKLKQTETHLMSLLAMRKKELYQRTRYLKSSNHREDASAPGRPDRSTDGGSSATGSVSTGSGDLYAKRTEEISSIEFLLEKMVNDRVAYSQTKKMYELKVTEYSNLMKQLTQELRNLEEVRKDPSFTIDAERFATMRSHEHSISDLEVKLDLVGHELEDLSAKLPKEDQEVDGAEEDADDIDETSEMVTAITKSEDSARRMISNLDAPTVRTILWNVLESLSKSEIKNCTLTAALKRKESALECFEAEVLSLNEKISSLSGEIGERRRLSSADGALDPLEIIRQKEKELAFLRDNFEQCAKERENAREVAKQAEDNLRSKEIELSEVREKLTVAQVAVKRAGGAEEAEQTLTQLQQVWNEVGVSIDDREVTRLQIEKCLEDTCAHTLTNAALLRDTVKTDINNLNDKLVNMYQALGMEEKISDIATATAGALTLSRHLDALKEKFEAVLPVYLNAVDRRSKLSSEVSLLIKALHPVSDSMLSTNVKAMIKSAHAGERRRRVHLGTEATTGATTSKKKREDMFRNIADMVKALEGESVSADQPLQATESTARDKTNSPEEPCSLSHSFLDECENDIKKLRLLKTETLVTNADARSRTQLLAREMHLNSRAVVSLTVHSTKKQRREFPEWWDHQLVDEVCRIITTKDAVVRSDGAFSRHLNFVHQCLESVAVGRRVLSQTLTGVVENAYKTLLTAVDGELYAKEAYESFHEALFRLPPLSKEHIRACIEEMETLKEAVDTMTQSEIEALTVVWDAVSITSTERGVFWSDVEQAVATIQSEGDGPFVDLFKACGADLEDWVRASAVDSKKVYRVLSTRLFKLGKIHQEVEAQRSKQDAKSKIIGLDSEIRILGAKLDEFEEKAGSRQRLVTKKVNSAALLKEEKFRRQMSIKMRSKLEALGKLLHEWEKKEGKTFDPSLLSDNVRGLLANPEEQTARMHLRANQKRGQEVPGMSHSQRPTTSSRARVAASPLRKSRPATTSRGLGISGNKTNGTGNTIRRGLGSTLVSAASSRPGTASSSARTGTSRKHQRQLQAASLETQAPAVKKQHLSPEDEEGKSRNRPKGLNVQSNTTANPFSCVLDTPKGKDKENNLNR